MSYYAIATKLKAILDVVQSTSPRLAVVYDTEVPEATSYPYAVLGNGPIEETILDTATNQALYNFTIRAVNVAKDKVAGEITMRKLADDMLAELRKRANQTLGGTVDRVLPFSLTWGWESSGTVPGRYFEINIQVLKDYSID